MKDKTRNINKYPNHNINIIGKGANIHIKVWYAINHIIYFNIHSLMIKKHSLAGPEKG